jgi:hypothetical protein
MNDTRTTIRLGNREIILIGTAHVSRESIDEVGRAIREESPGQVCVELDAGRYTSMTQRDNWEKLDMAKVFKEGKGFLLMANLVLSGFQRRMGAELGVKPGEEMKAALDAAAELGIPHSLCDREVQLTLRRAWGRCGLWSKCKLLASLISSALTTEKLSGDEIEALKKGSELDGMMEELAAYLPSVKATLIDERDRYLAAKIWTAGTAGAIGAAGAVGAAYGKETSAASLRAALGSERATGSGRNDEAEPPAADLPAEAAETSALSLKLVTGSARTTGAAGALSTAPGGLASRVDIPGPPDIAGLFLSTSELIILESSGPGMGR